VALEPVSFSHRETSEDWLQQQIDKHPELLPIDEVGTAWGPLVSLGREIPLTVGFVDNLYVSPAGEVTVVEAKLWRNPEARRKVIGQILDYASALAALSYEELEAVVREASPDDDRSIWQRLLDSAHAPEVDSEARFVDTVSRNLRMGRFLLLVVGDGIRSDLHSLAALLGSQPSLGFHLELVELRLYRMPDGDLLAIPGLIGRTQEVERAVVEIRNPEHAAVSVAVEMPPPAERRTDGRFESVESFVAAVADSVGEERAEAFGRLVSWWQQERSGVVKLNKRSVNLTVPSALTKGGSVSAMTLYDDGRAMGTVAPMSTWRSIVPADDALARFQAAGFAGHPEWPECDLDCTRPEERDRIERLLVWADEVIRSAG
jgi:hypothetical protein